MKSLSAQLRAIIVGSRLAQHEIARRAGVDQSALARFVSRERGLSMHAVDALGALFEIRVVAGRPSGRRSEVTTNVDNPDQYRVRCVNNRPVGVIDAFPRDGSSFKQWEAAIRAKYERETGKRITLTHYRVNSPDGRRRLPREWAEKFGFIQAG